MLYNVIFFLFQIYYVIRAFVQDKLQGFEVLVDNWPPWSCIILRPLSEQHVCIVSIILVTNSINYIAIINTASSRQTLK